jgi:hypothetical protein
MKSAHDLTRREVLYRILIAFIIVMNLVMLIKLSLNQTYKIVRVSKYLPGNFLNQSFHKNVLLYRQFFSTSL